MRVYDLCNYRNSLSHVIPQAVIDRPPSAELAPGQLDQDSLPPYETLDEILNRYVERDWSIADIVNDGFDEAMVRRVAAMVIRNEYKRRQGAPGVRVTSRAFGRDRRYPITSGWHEERLVMNLVNEWEDRYLIHQAAFQKRPEFSQYQIARLRVDFLR